MASQHSADIQVLGKDIILNMLPKRIQNSHKGTYGHVLNIAGSSQFQGAAYLSSIASLKVGAGYSMLASCSDVINTVAAKSADITFLDLGQSCYGTIPKDAIKYIKGDIQPERFIKCIETLNEFFISFSKIFSCLFCN